MHTLKALLNRISSPCICMLRRQSTVQKRQQPRNRPAVKGGSWDAGIVLLIVPVTTFGLGVWQVRRREWKLEMIKMLKERTTATPVPLPDSLEEIEDLEYQNVLVRGHFLHRQEMRIGPRSNTQPDTYSSAGGGGGLISSGRQTGFNVVTPFKLADRDLTILVNRGWIPKGRDQALYLKPESQIKGEVEVVGVVRITEKRGAFTPKNDPKSETWIYRDLPAMARSVDAAPIFIDANLDSTVPGGPIGGQTIVTLRNEHEQYILTWFSLSAITFYLWYRRYWRPVPSKLLHELYHKQKAQK